MKTVQFHFDFGSPNAYLSHLVIPDIERRTGATFETVLANAGRNVYLPIVAGYGTYDGSPAWVILSPTR